VGRSRVEATHLVPPPAPYGPPLPRHAGGILCPSQAFVGGCISGGHVARAGGCLWRRRTHDWITNRPRAAAAAGNCNSRHCRHGRSVACSPSSRDRELLLDGHVARAHRRTLMACERDRALRGRWAHRAAADWRRPQRSTPRWHGLAECVGLLSNVGQVPGARLLIGRHPAMAILGPSFFVWASAKHALGAAQVPW
jgi:hypothetical protein